jgi:hypothetical protein
MGIEGMVAKRALMKEIDFYKTIKSNNKYSILWLLASISKVILMCSACPEKIKPTP